MTVRFAGFTLDRDRRQLMCGDANVHLTPKAFDLLVILVSEAPRVVRKTELHERLWPETYVSDATLTGLIKEVRHALNGHGSKEPIIRTVHGVGYALSEHPEHLSPVPESLNGHGLVVPTGQMAVQPAERGALASRASPRVRLGKIVLLAGTVLVLVAAAGLGIWRLVWRPVPRITSSKVLTRSGQVMFPNRRLMHFPRVATDGARIYFGQAESGPSWGKKLAHVPSSGGPISNLPTPFGRQVLHGISPDGSRLLLQGQTTTLGFETREGKLWALPLTGEGPVRLGDVLAHDAAWSSDGARLAFANGDDLYLANWDGSNPRKLVTTVGRAYWIRWAPDDTHLRFTVIDRNTHATLWEVRADGAGLLRLLPNWSDKAIPCCGEWSPDGRYFMFLVYEDDRSDIWIRRESHGFFQPGSKPVRLTSGPLPIASAIFNSGGNSILAVSPQAQGQVFKFDLKKRRTEPVAGNRLDMNFSSDRHWIVYVTPSRTLWRSRADGTDALQLTTKPLEAGFPTWSPDGKQIAFIGRMPGGPFKLYVVPSAGGSPRQLIPGDRQESDPNWSPDGNSIMFGRPPDVLAEQGMSKGIYILNLRNAQTSLLPGSERLFAPRWSPNGRFVVAMPHDNWDRLLRFDFKTQNWSVLVPFSANNTTLTRDGEWVYFESEYKGQNMSRVRLRDGKIERLFDYADLTRGTLMTCLGAGGVELDGSPLLACVVNASELYAMDVYLP
jgi:Tol biopolymer transport system component/DNA-binding winged helix-turn-helix (wHTH) protein